MAPKTKSNQIIQIKDCLDRLAPIELAPPAEDKQSSLHSAELRSSVLNIANLDHVSETVQVQDAVKNALGDIPPVE